MANLVQSDYDTLQGQLQSKKRTAGANSGKTMREVSALRYADMLRIAIIYADSTLETLVFDPNVDAYAPGSADTLAHYHPSTCPPTVVPQNP
jgi:hypothetical protein